MSFDGIPMPPMEAIPIEHTRHLRHQVIPASCKLHFAKAPLKITRALGQYMYDNRGVEYLDCANCTAHVGHCNQMVLDAAKKAMAQIGSISFGLNDSAVAYIDKLKTVLPPCYDAFLFVSSGSEANDLAVNMARAYTGGHDVVAVDKSFHGSLSLTELISPKHHPVLNGKKAEWVHVIPCPDLYRGKHRDTDPTAVEKYCIVAEEIIENVTKNGRKISCFISETLLMIPGVIVPPSQWIKRVYSAIRRQGGVSIADEAQTGLGRCGSSWWAFEIHENIYPDIITIGKPIGNGHPMALVVTKSSIAQQLASLPSEFGGVNSEYKYLCDNVSAAVGSAVLDCIRSESLKFNANTVGAFLKEGLKALATKHNKIGDVRGMGLMIGVDIVIDKESRKPNAELAEQICYNMKENHIIMANEGADKNVLTITPPMCFNMENAHRVIKSLDSYLSSINNIGSDGSQSEINEEGLPYTIPGQSLVGNRIISMTLLKSMDEEYLDEQIFSRDRSEFDEMD